MPTQPDLHAATDEELGRTCPYCQTSLEAGDAAATCGDCGAAHHGDCWSENGGCAITGCASAPDPTLQTAAAPSVGAPTEERLSISLDASSADGLSVTRETVSAAPVGLPPKRRSRGLIIAGVLTSALVLGGLGVVLGGGSTSAGPGGPAAEAQVECAGRPAATAPAANSADAPLAGGSREELAATVKLYMAAIREGEDDEAYSCLAPRWRTSFVPGGEPEDNQPWWWQRQKLLQAHLPASLPTLSVVRGKWVSSSSGTPTARFELGSIPWTGAARCNPSGAVLWASQTQEAGDRIVWALEPSIPGQASRQAVSRAGRDGAKALYRSGCTG